MNTICIRNDVFLIVVIAVANVVRRSLFFLCSGIVKRVAALKVTASTRKISLVFITRTPLRNRRGNRFEKSSRRLDGRARQKKEEKKTAPSCGILRLGLNNFYDRTDPATIIKY